MGSCFSRKSTGASGAGSKVAGLRRPGQYEGSRQNEDGFIVAVVGRTGSGLSQFIHDTFESVPVMINEISTSRRVVFIDTPGFDYSDDNDEYTTFKQLSRWLRDSYGPRVRLDGVIYMHNIWNEEVYHRSPLLTCGPLEELCGHDWRQKVILVNSHWDEHVKDDSKQREASLKTGYWRFMLSKDSPMVRYESPGDRKRAIEILKMIINPDQITRGQPL
ncbi:hypothetical protein P691DRAFT_471053 [Macrolepiota fuliginosa MF-IS2]|uniref:G domain-containing protein n=1 Tax=Macrolepiota fuliginosa MF-IS2 TaxID=1400762 RepID=A0A9P5XFD6_9AGAR|nr:hypothetical protein P691DRAFT_471053 [Macrolepiota fuliginosa MF-IS2]